MMYGARGQWSGINAVMFYCGTILQTIFPDPQTANRLAIGVQALQLAVTLASALFMDRAGRKPLLILGLMLLCCRAGLTPLSAYPPCSQNPEAAGQVAQALATIRVLLVF